MAFLVSFVIALTGCFNEKIKFVSNLYDELFCIYENLQAQELITRRHIENKIGAINLETSISIALEHFSKIIISEYAPLYKNNFKRELWKFSILSSEFYLIRQYVNKMNLIVEQGKVYANELQPAVQQQNLNSIGAQYTAATNLDFFGNSK